MYNPKPTQEELRELAQEFGDDELLEDVEECFLSGNRYLAQIRLLGHVDKLVIVWGLDSALAAKYYERIGLSVDEMTTIRQNAALDTHYKKTGA